MSLKKLGQRGKPPRQAYHERRKRSLLRASEGMNGMNRDSKKEDVSQKMREKGQRKTWPGICEDVTRARRDKDVATGSNSPARYHSHSHDRHHCCHPRYHHIHGRHPSHGHHPTPLPTPGAATHAATTATIIRSTSTTSSTSSTKSTTTAITTTTFTRKAKAAATTTGR